MKFTTNYTQQQKTSNQLNRIKNFRLKQTLIIEKLKLNILLPTQAKPLST